MLQLQYSWLPLHFTHWLHCSDGRPGDTHTHRFTMLCPKKLLEQLKQVLFTFIIQTTYLEMRGVTVGLRFRSTASYSTYHCTQLAAFAHLLDYHSDVQHTE